MMVEDIFGTPFNTLPALDWAGIANSYGYGQIAPETALHVLQKYRSKLGRFPNLLAKLEEVEKKMAAGHTYSKKELADALELRTASNIIPAMLCFNDANIGYSRIHDPKSKTNVSEGKIDPKENQRALSLTIVAYSAKVSSPAVAKVQSAINDIIVFKPELAKSIGLPTTPLDVEGDMQKISEGAFRKMAAAFGDPTLNTLIDQIKELQDKPGITPNIEAISTFANRISGKIDIDGIINGFALRGNGPQLVSAVASRYGTTVALYDQLRKKVPQKNAKSLNDLFNAYVDHRDSNFFAVLSDRTKFAEFFPNLKYEDFLSLAAEKYLEGYYRDQRYMGVVPTMYKPGKDYLIEQVDPKNAMQRVIEAHQFFGNPIFKEPEFESRLEEARKRAHSQLEDLQIYALVNNHGTPGIKNIVDGCVRQETSSCIDERKPVSCEQDYQGSIRNLKDINTASLQCQTDIYRVMKDCYRTDVVDCIKANEKVVQERLHEDDPDYVYEDETN